MVYYINRGHVMGFYQETMAGIDCALWDVWGNAQVPVWRLLGGATNTSFGVMHLHFGCVL